MINYEKEARSQEPEENSKLRLLASELIVPLKADG
jgi:hypothetical protein